MISFDMREGHGCEPVRKKISEYLCDQFKIETHDIENSRFYEYKTFITIPSMSHLEELKNKIVEYFESEDFKTNVEFNIKFTMTNPILTIIYDRR